MVALPAAAQNLQTPIGTIIPNTGRALAIEDYYRVKSVGAPQMSPDGRWVAFAISRRIEETNGDSSDVWLVPADGSARERRVSPVGAEAGSPSWMDDGKLRMSGGGKAWTLDPSAPDALTESADASNAAGRGGRGGGRGGAAGGGRGSLPSPDGKWTASLRNTPPPRRERTYTSDFEKRHEDRFKGVEFDWLNFQRDGGQFPVPNAADPQVNPPQEIFLAPAGGGDERQLTHLGLRPASVGWVKDGARLVFTADSLYRNERRYGAEQLWSVGTDGAAKRLTSDGDFEHTGAQVSPDGKWILYTHQMSTDAIIARKLDHGAATDLAVMPVGGGAERNLTAEWDYLPTGARWSPDGRSIYFSGGVGGTTHLFRVSPEGGPVSQVTKGERRVASLSFDRGMTKMAFTVGRFEAPSEISVAGIDGSGEKQLTHVFDDFTKEVALSKAERLQYRSKDGTPIEGWLYYPYNYRREAGPYPMIVFSHGGPHSAVGYAFDFKLQYFAANGYFVLTTNFRSSTGYGERFLWATWGAWGNKDGEDVIAGMDYAIAHFPIDRARVATVGHSYGGFMSNWLITQYPDRFKAAAVGAGIVNWVSDYGTADIAVTKETEFYGSPWEEKARNIMIAQSPLTYANRVKAATLFIHGEVDQRVPYSEGEQMYFALKKNGVPAKMIQYAGQPHGIAGSWNNVHRMINEMAWIDRYLGKTRS